MSRHKFWRGITSFDFNTSEHMPNKITKLCSIGLDFFILGSDHLLYYSSNLEDDKANFTRVPSLLAIDVAYCQNTLYLIDIQGRLYKSDPYNLENKEEIIVKEEAKCCPHGFKSASFKVKFKNVIVGDFGQLFISSDGELWGSGIMPQISLDCNDIRKIPFFEGRTIHSASIGANFAAVIARKKISTSNNCDTDSENEDEEVFASNCPHCRTIINLASPASVPSISETCPLGMQISKSSDESSSTAPQTDIHIDCPSCTEDSSPSSEEPRKKTIIGKNVDISCNPEENNISSSDPKFDESSCISDQNTEQSTGINDDKTNNIFINTDAARQFLSKQLSWVAVGEDYLVEYTEKPTRIIKENVSNLTNFVYEGVKTVGDKVATLSRHVSGSSDTEVVELHLRGNNQEINSLIYSCASVCNLDELQFSTSTISSEKDFEIAHNHINLENMSKLGQNILATELWTWGDITYGQLGIGDTIKRVKPIQIANLSGFGLQKVSCGKWHCAALTLDGRLFIWGYNNYHQVCCDSRENKSGPKQFIENNSDSDRIRDIDACNHHTLAYSHNENVFYMGKHLDGYTKTVCNLKNKNNDDTNENNNSDFPHDEASQNVQPKSKSQNVCCHWRVLTSGDITYSVGSETVKPQMLPDLAIAQRYLEEMLLIYHSVIKPFLKKSKVITVHSNLYETICDIFRNILNVTALSVLSMWQYVEKHINELEISIIKYIDEYIYLYKKYCSVLCNLIVIGGFAQINNVIDVPTTIYNLFSDQLPSNKQKNNKKTLESVVGLALVQPLTRLSSYKCIVQSLLRHNIKISKENVKLNTCEKLNKIISTIDLLLDEQDKKKKEAEATKLFWDTMGKALEQHRTPERRIVRESRSRALNLLHPGRFTSHWFVLFNDIFIHLSGSTHYVHPLETIWVDISSNTDSTQNNVIQLITPEEVLSLSTTTEQDKIEWTHAFNSAIHFKLNKGTSLKPPSIRAASYTFTNKSQFYKDAKYHGRWLDGKMHGTGRVEWPDGKVYVGQFQMNSLCGHGRMDIPNVGIYEGQWKDNLQNGYGVMKYSSGDIYEGYFKDGLPHGHGVKRQGDFTTSTATIYMGEWGNGLKQGYGVMDDIGKGEKYLGIWSDNKKHGCGLIVTLDGIYYEGLFMNDVLTGHGVMVFEDGTHYEGEFRSAGVFCGKGTLTFSSGDKIEGSLNGAWTEGVKIANATLQLNISNPAPPANSKPSSFGKLCVAPNQKWNALFRQCYQSLGVPENSLTPMGNHLSIISTSSSVDNKKIWQNLAVAISCSHKDKHNRNINKYSAKKSELEKSVDCLEVIPQFGQKSLNLQSYNELKQYLQMACESSHHPLGQLVLGLTNAFNTTYGGVRVHPLLLSHAVKELKSITSRLYQVVRLLFPGLPPEGIDLVLPYENNKQLDDDCENIEDINPIDGEIVSAASLLQPNLLPRVHHSLFVLYALHNKREDDLYWRRLLKWNRQPDITLMAFLGIDQKFWVGYATNNTQISPSYSPVKEQLFNEAVETLQQLKTTFSPIEKLLVIRSTFQKLTIAVQQELGESYLWSMDELFPVFHFVVVRARILQLGSEIHFVEDFLEPGMQHGELGLMFTTLKACYFQILQEKVTINS